MKRKLHFLSRVVILFLLVCIISGAFVKQNYAGNIDEEKKKQEELQKELKDTKSLINKLEGLKGDAEAYIAKLDQRLNELSDSIYSLEKNLVETRQNISAIKVAIEDKKKDIDIQYNAMKKRIQYMYENGENSYLSMIFASEDISDFLSRAEYFSQITSYDRSQLEKLKQSKADLDAKEVQLKAEEKEYSETLTELEEEKKASEELLAAKKTTIDGYNRDIASTKGEAAQIAEDLKTQKAIVAELEAIEKKREEENKKNELNKLTYDGGTMAWPLPGYSRLSSYYGTRPDPFGKPTQEFHSGIDIPAPNGTKIVAAYDGQVAWSNYSSSAGNWVGIDHGNGIYTVYMHMSKRLVSEGQTVKKGDVIGLVGSTGRSTGNHLHFGVRKNGSYVDPLKWVTP